MDLVKDGFYTDIALFRCVKRFLTQFGITDNPAKKHWHHKEILDDPNIGKGIKKHYISYAGGGPNTRSTQIFIAFEDLDFLGKEPWEVPFGMVVEGEDVLNALYKGYGDIPPFGKGPDQRMIHSQGNQYVRENFPFTDFIKFCKMIDEEPVDTSLIEPAFKIVPILGVDGKVETVNKQDSQQYEIPPNPFPKIADLETLKTELQNFKLGKISN